jgi:hypothetical protein
VERERRYKKNNTLPGVERGSRLRPCYKRAQDAQGSCEDLVAWFAENKALSPTLQEVVR